MTNESLCLVAQWSRTTSRKHNFSLFPTKFHPTTKNIHYVPKKKPAKSFSSISSIIMCFSVLYMILFDFMLLFEHNCASVGCKYKKIYCACISPMCLSMLSEEKICVNKNFKGKFLHFSFCKFSASFFVSKFYSLLLCCP